MAVSHCRRGDGEPPAGSRDVRGINLAKGRPIDQVGSITTTRARVAEVFDCSRLP
jgi:hypothetical protein